MRKRITTSVVCVSMMLLFSSCTLYLGDQTWQLPWWTVTLFSVIPAILIVCIVAYATLKDNVKAYYACPRCGHRFKPGYRLLWSFHVGDEYSLKCPNCSKRDMCSISYDQET